MRVTNDVASVERPAPRARGSSKGPGEGIARIQQTRQRAALPPKKPKQRIDLSPDPAAKRLLDLMVDPRSGNLRVAGTQPQLLSFAKGLSERKGRLGANAYFTLASTGIPLASLGETARKNAAEYLKDLAVRGVDLTGTPRVSVLEPDERDAIRRVLKLKGVDPGASASDAEILSATHKHKLTNKDIIRNLPSSAGKALVGLPAGAWGLGQVAGAAVFDQNLDPAKQVAAGVVDYYGHIKDDPMNALREDPVGTVSALLPAKTLVGGAAGKAAKAGLFGRAAKGFATAERQALTLPKARLSNDPAEAPQVIPALDQGPLSSNLIDRGIQRGLEGITARSPALSRKRVNQLSSRREAEARFAAYQKRDELLRGVLGAKRKLTREEKRAVTAIAQGVTPRQMAEYYKIKAAAEPGSKHLKAQVDVWEKVAAKAPDLSDRMRAYLDAAEPAVRDREASLQRVTTIDESKLQAREGITRDEVLTTLRNAESPVAAETTGRDPFYFPHVKDSTNFSSFLFRRGMNPTRRLNPELKKNDLALFTSGRWQPDTRHLEARIASAPLAEMSLNHLQGQIKEFGRKVAPGSAYDPRHATLVRVHPAGAKTEKIDTSGEGLAQQIRDVKANSRTDKDFLQRLESQIVVHAPDGKVPNEDGLVLVPNEVMDQVRGTLKSMNRGGMVRGLQTATDAWRYMTLYLRGGYLTNNIAGNTLQAGIGGIGPVSVGRALKYGDAVPKKLVGSGTMADLSRIQRLGGNADTAAGRALNAIAESPVGRGVSAAAGKNPIMRGNVAYEDTLRKALYLRHAIPEAKKAVNGSRFSRVTDDVIKHLEQNEIPQATQRVVDFLGDMRKKNRANLRLSVPFYRWISFITKLSLATLPLKYPVRNELIQSIGRLGNDELAKMGLLPEWFRGSIPVSTSQQDVNGSKHQMADMLSTQGLNPFATIDQRSTAAPPARRGF